MPISQRFTKSSCRREGARAFRKLLICRRLGVRLLGRVSRDVTSVFVWFVEREEERVGHAFLGYVCAWTVARDYGYGAVEDH